MTKSPLANVIKLVTIIVAGIAPAWALEGQIKSADAVLARYKQALGGMNAKTRFVYFAKPFKTLIKVARANGTESISGFDGSVSWSIDPRSADHWWRPKCRRGAPVRRFDSAAAPTIARRSIDVAFSARNTI